MFIYFLFFYFFFIFCIFLCSLLLFLFRVFVLSVRFYNNNGVYRPTLYITVVDLLKQLNCIFKLCVNQFILYMD